MTARWPTVLVCSLAIGSALLWSYALTRPLKAAAPPPTPLAAAVPTDLTRLLGADPPPAPVEAEAAPAAQANMQLIGVVSPSSDDGADEGLALIAINGQPAKVYRVGMVVDGDTVLQAVGPRDAKLGPLGGAIQVALSTAALGSAAAPGLQLPGAPMAAALPPPAAPPSMPAPLPATPAADGTPPPFGGPPQAFGGAPPAPAQALPRRGVTR